MNNKILHSYRYSGLLTVSGLFRLILVLIFMSAWSLRESAAATVTVTVAPGRSLTFSPRTVTIQPGDTVKWVWEASDHTATSGTPDAPTTLFNSGLLNTGATFSFTFTNQGTFDYFCQPHGACCAMVGTVTVGGASTPTPTPTPTPTATPPSVSQALNISTRIDVGTGDRVLIGGFIVTGTDPKKVMLRAIGPSLAGAGISDPLANPVLELHSGDGTVLTTNNNWQDTQRVMIEATGLQPLNPLESAILATLEPGNYTAIVTGKNGGTGVALVEGYDLDEAADSQLANISTRGFVETGANVMIGGFILGGPDGSANVIVRALGPSLGAAGVADALADPTLELHNQNGDLIQSNDNWKDSQKAAIMASHLAPMDDRESAVIATLAAGNYTAIVAGKNETTGVGLVEVYRLP